MTAAAQTEVRCPAHARFAGDIVGCGSTNVTQPDDEGLHDCADCGLFFRSRAKEIELAREAGYSVHGPSDRDQRWAYAIDGDYSDEFPTEQAAWEAAIAEMHAEPDSTCGECSTKVKEIIGTPGGAEICRSCFDAGMH